MTDNEEGQVGPTKIRIQYDRDFLLQIGRSPASKKTFNYHDYHISIIRPGGLRPEHAQLNPQFGLYGGGRLKSNRFCNMDPASLKLAGHSIGWARLGQPLPIPPIPLSGGTTISCPPREYPSMTVKLRTTPNPWRPSRHSSNYSASNTTLDEQLVTKNCVKTARGILNKLTQTNFTGLCNKFLKLELNDQDDRISAVVDVVLKKAMDEPMYSAGYARLIQYACMQSQELAKKIRKEILDHCQIEFLKTNEHYAEIRMAEAEIAIVAENRKPQLLLKLAEKRDQMRERSLSNINFVGELYKLQMLTPKIMVDIVQMLYNNNDENSYERLAVLLQLVGQRLDNQLNELVQRIRQAKASNQQLPKFIPDTQFMDKLMTKLELLGLDSQSKLMSPRIRFALLGVVDLRKNDWKPRHEKIWPEIITVIRQKVARRKHAAAPSHDDDDAETQNLSKSVSKEMTTSDEKFFKVALTLVDECKLKLAHCPMDQVLELTPMTEWFEVLKMEKNCSQPCVEQLVQKIFSILLVQDEDPNSALFCAKILYSVTAIGSSKNTKKFRKAILLHCQQQSLWNLKVDQNSDQQNPADKIQSTDCPPVTTTKMVNLHVFGYLYHFEMFPAKIVLDFIHVLFENQDEESYTCLCSLLAVTGQKLEKELSQLKQVSLITADTFVPPYNFMNHTFAELKKVANNELNFSQNLRLNLQKLIQLRNDNWTIKSENQGHSQPDSFEPHLCDEFVQDLYQQLQSPFNKIRAEFPGDKIFFIVAGLAKQIVTAESTSNRPSDEGPRMAGKLINILISQGLIQHDAVIWILSQGVFPKMTDVDSNKINQISQFVLEIFGDEPNLNWLVELIQNMGDDLAMKENLVRMTLAQLQFLKGDIVLQVLLSETTVKWRDFIPTKWLPMAKLKETNASTSSPINSTHIVHRLRNGDLNGLLNMFQTNATDDLLKNTLLAVCDLCFVDGAWDSIQLDIWLSVLSSRARMSPVTFHFSSKLWEAALDCLRQKNARPLDELFLWTRLVQFNLVLDKNDG